jgi:hypothetical protein
LWLQDLVLLQQGGKMAELQMPATAAAAAAVACRPEGTQYLEVPLLLLLLLKPARFQLHVE